MSSVTVNVVRWSALACGIVYGAVHHQTLAKALDLAHEAKETKQKETFVNEAREAWKNKNKKRTEGGVVLDPRDPAFNLEDFVKLRQSQQ